MVIPYVPPHQYAVINVYKSDINQLVSNLKGCGSKDIILKFFLSNDNTPLKLSTKRINSINKILTKKI